MSRLRALFARYANHHFRLTYPGCPLPGGAGYLDLVHETATRIVLEGWADADSVIARNGGDRVATAPSLTRHDVSRELGLRADVGFRLEIARNEDQTTLEILRSGQTHSLDVPPPHARWYRRTMRCLLWQFLRDLLHAAPHLPRALLWNDLTARARVKSCLRLNPLPQDRAQLETRLFDCQGLPQGPTATPVTIILPVYNAFDLLPEALDRIAQHTDLPWHLVIVNDASTDARIAPFLAAWAEWHGPRVTLLENASNLGFVGAANQGLSVAVARQDHVILLNSDAMVPTGWASRLIRPILRHADIASVTPMSNDATIMTAPVICERHDLAKGTGDRIDAVARQFNPEALLSVVPTGVGFCMAMNGVYLRHVATLDPAFGRGYGEEVDWCQRVRHLGGRHLALPSLFVEHRGAGSFGSATKDKLIRRNNQIIAARYPEYDGEVRQFIAEDPMITARLALGIAEAAATCLRAVPIYVAHSLGGGAEAYLQSRLQGDLLSSGAAIVLRLGGATRWRVELHTETGLVAGGTDSFDFVERLLAPIARRRLIYSCAVGDPDPFALPDKLLRLVRDGTPDRLEVLMHDFFALSPSYTLLDSNHVYRGPVREGERDRAHTILRPNGELVDLAAWRAAWKRLLLAAHDIVVFSTDSQCQLLAVYPWLEHQIKLRPHKVSQPTERLSLSVGQPQVIGVLGNIGIQKGADVVSRLSWRLKNNGVFGLVVMGTIDPAYELSAETPVTGPYKPQDIANLAKQHGITHWLIPSIWPETFSYTTHEALLTGLPVLAFDIGAQGEAVAKAANGIAVPFDPSADLVDSILNTLQTSELRSAA
ncbi:MAG: glycosyltransferase [Pseudomonadota bacterium]